MNGLFCASFASSRECWTPCRAVWCGACYTPHPRDNFYHFFPTDEAGFDWRPALDQRPYAQARDGDHLLVPFQCDLCIFCNLTFRNPLPDAPKDTLFLSCIRRINLDSVWGREAGTVNATLHAAQQMITLMDKVDVHPDLPTRGPFPLQDSFGARAAICMLLKSLEPGHYQDHQQFETIRKLRAGFANMYMSSASGAFNLRTVGGNKTKYSLSDSPTQSLWFERFSRGCLARMGQEVHQDWEIPLEVMHALQDLLEQEWRASGMCSERNLVAILGAYIMIAFCGSFRGSEVLLVDLHGL